MGRVLKKIAVTGGIASGKTTVCHIFETKGATVVYADKIVHELLKKELKEKIIREFGTQIAPHKEIDPEILSGIVFQNPEKLEKLEKIIHPAVLKKIDEAYQNAKGSCFIAEIPLLYEIGAEKFFDGVIVVLCDEERAKKRFNKGRREYEARMRRQIDPQEKGIRAQYVIENNGTLEELEEKSAQILAKIEELNVTE